jgi:ABC-type oligopeptide transport system ATPase subunit
MHAGRIVEVGPADSVLGRPGHPYTQALLAAAPVPDPARRANRPAPRPWSGTSGPLLPHGQDWWVAA